MALADVRPRSRGRNPSRGACRRRTQGRSRGRSATTLAARQLSRAVRPARAGARSKRRSVAGAGGGALRGDGAGLARREGAQPNRPSSAPTGGGVVKKKSAQSEPALHRRKLARFHSANPLSLRTFADAHSFRKQRHFGNRIATSSTQIARNV